MVISDQYEHFEGIKCTSMEYIRGGKDEPLSKAYCSKDKSCLAVVYTERGIKSCNYPNVIIPATRNPLQAPMRFHKKQVVSGRKITGQYKKVRFISIFYTYPDISRMLCLL